MIFAYLLMVLLVLNVIHAMDFIPGADPSGHADSSHALNVYIRAICTNTTTRTSMHFGMNALSLRARDATMNLEGGIYLLNAPITVNSTVNCTGMLRIQGGTLLAGPKLNTHGNSSFLVTVLQYWNGLGVSLEKMVFASNNIGGGLRVDAAHHIHAVDCNFLNFATVGIWGSNLLGMGHDLVVERCRLTECTAGFTECSDVRKKKATAILMEFPDSHFRNTVITCGLVGIVNHAGANTFHQLHIWPSCNPEAEGDNLTVAFSEETGNSRISDCYFDNSRFLITGYRGTTITNSYFNGRSRLELAKSIHSGLSRNKTDTRCQYWRGDMCGLIINNNRFTCAKDSCSFIDWQYMPQAASQIYISSNAFENVSSTLCSNKHSCTGETDCHELLGPCKN